MSDKNAPKAITPEQARKRRNLATGLAITGFIVLIFLVSMARIKANLGG